MKIITVTGYYGTGSSAVTDLISELDNVYSLGETEYRFLHDPNGVSDLEFKIVENFNRHNSSYAIKCFLNFAKFLDGIYCYKKYSKTFNNKFMKYTYDYIDDLIQFKYRGFWYYDVLDKGLAFDTLDRMCNKLIHKINKLAKRNIFKSCNFLNEDEMIVYDVKPDEENFIHATQKYISNLFGELHSDDKEFLMIDQLVASSNIKRYLRYFVDPIYIFLVDRDPRDLYILDKVYWGNNGFPDSVEEFCKHYKLLRCTRTRELQNKEVYFIQFEDLVYRYEDTCKKVFKFINIDEQYHVRKFNCFNPDISKNNTQLWLKHKEFNREMEYIKNNLNEYLYDYTDLPMHEFTNNTF